MQSELSRVGGSSQEEKIEDGEDLAKRGEESRWKKKV